MFVSVEFPYTSWIQILAFDNPQLSPECRLKGLEFRSTSQFHDIVDSSVTKHEMGSLYRSLSATRKEIRLLRILPGTFDPNTVYCSLETCSLADVTSDYQAFITDPAISTLPKSAIAEKWAEIRLSPPLAR